MGCKVLKTENSGINALLLPGASKTGLGNDSCRIGNMFRVKQTFQAMGTRCEIDCFASRPRTGQIAIDFMIAEVHRLEAKYSRYRETSFLSAINRAALTGEALEVDAETAHLLDYATTCFEQSEGLFDISSGVLRKAWNFHEPSMPDSGVVAALLQRVGWQRVQWLPPWLHFPAAGMELDLGGVVKEYAADRLATVCREAGVEHALVNLGGDIRVVGPHPDGSPWSIGIQDPRKLGKALVTVNLYQGALASSGDYERSIELDGKRYSHVLNPKTGWPVSKLAAVSVLADFCVIAGSASTIGMLQDGAGKQWLEGLGLPYLWVDVDGCSGGPLLEVC